MLEDAAGNGYADGDEDQAAEEFAPLAGLGAEPVTKLQADQGQGDADRADDDRGNGEVDVVGAQDEADREVVDAQRDPGDQQLPGSLLGRFGRGLMMLARAAADGLQHRVAAGGDQQCGADPVGGAAERVSEAVAQQETQEGIPASNIPKMRPTRSRVPASTPATPMPTATAKLDSPSETATSSRASTGLTLLRGVARPRM